MPAMPRLRGQRRAESGGSEDGASEPAPPEKSPLDAAGGGCGEKTHPRVQGVCISRGGFSLGAPGQAGMSLIPVPASSSPSFAGCGSWMVLPQPQPVPAASGQPRGLTQSCQHP